MATDVFARGQSHGLTCFLVRCKLDHCLGKCGHVARGNQSAVHAVVDLLRSSADVGGDDPQPGGERFQRGVRAVLSDRIVTRPNTVLIISIPKTGHKENEILLGQGFAGNCS